MFSLSSATNSCKRDALFKHITDRDTDSITQHELWDIATMAQLEARLKFLNKEEAKKEQLLKEAITPENSYHPEEEFCDLHPGNDSCEINDITGKDNYNTVARRLRDYKTIQIRKNKLHDYIQRRYIKERMESLFGVDGYLVFEVLIFALIFLVLAALVVEFSYFEYILQNGNLDNYHKPIASGMLTGLTIYHIAIFDLIAGVIFLSEYCLRYHYSHDKTWYLKNHKIDLISSIPLTGLIVVTGFATLFPDLMFLRVVRLLRIFRAMRIASFFWRGMERLDQVADVKMMQKSLIIIVVLTLLGAILLSNLGQSTKIQLDETTTSQSVDKSTITNSNNDDLSAIQLAGLLKGHILAGTTNPDKSSEKIFENFWITLTTLTSGDFAEFYKPDSGASWAVSIFLVISGIVVIGIFTATLTSIFRGEDSDELKHIQNNIHAAVDKLPEKIKLLIHSQHNFEETVKDLQHDVGLLKKENQVIQSQLKLNALQSSHEKSEKQVTPEAST